jgi:chromosome segregation ATPase
LSHACRLEELLEVKEALQKQLEGTQADLEAAAGQLAESRKKGEALAAQLATAEEAKGVAEKVGGSPAIASVRTTLSLAAGSAAL